MSETHGDGAADSPSSTRVALGKRSYDIVVGPGLLAQAGAYVAPLLARKQVVVVTDRTVADIHLATVENSLNAAGIASQAVIVPPGERTKSFAGLEDLVDRLLRAGIERSTTLIALGGGVVGDLTGFAASIVLRGVDYVQIPTTLLAQVDSAVGGKTGINTKRGKNLVGTFHQPRLVLADTRSLDTLPRRQVLAGYAEVVKYGLIRDAGFFAWLEANGNRVIDGDDDARRHAVLQSCRTKAAIVAEDEREAGARAVLNLGHTFGHALEAVCGYTDKLLHGEAVAVGMVLAFDLSVRLGLCPAADAARVRRHLASVGLPAGLDAHRLRGRSWDADEILAHMRHDKKVRAGRLTFVLTRGIGTALVSREVDPGDVRDLLRSAAAA